MNTKLREEFLGKYIFIRCYMYVRGEGKAHPSLVFALRTD